MGLSRMGDEIVLNLQSDELNRVKDWKLKLCWIPNKCFLSGKILWGKYAYHGIRIITGPGEPIRENYWVEKNEFLIWNLKGRTKWI